MEHPSQVDQAPPASAGTVLGVEIVAGGGELDPLALRAAIGDELGVTITDGTAFAPDLGRLVITIERGEARIAYQPAAGTRVERTLALPFDPAERAELISYVATNLVRDQTSEVLAGLPERPGVVIPQIPEARLRTSYVAPRPPTRRVAATIGFIPPLSVDRVAGAHVEVGAGLHALVGVTDASTLFSLSGLVDVQRQSATGVQIAGLAAVAGRVNALQIGGLLAGAPQDVKGVQIGGVVAAGGHDVEGVQIGGVASIAKGRMHGLQIGGVANVADRVRGGQIGLVNVAGKLSGVQIGLINITEDGDDAYPIGLINYSKNGGVSIDGWVESTRVSAVALRHGTKHIHNVWGIAWSPDHDHLLAGAGLGYHADLTGGLGFDLDAMNWWTNVWDGELGQLNQLRASVSLPVGGVEIFGGAAANVYIGDEMDESANFHPVAARTVITDGGTNVVTWPSVFAGVRIKAK